MRKLSWLFAVMFWMTAHVPAVAGDSDDDGIPNKYDLCPKEPEDMDGFEDTDGCPDPDNDKDGVCDPWVGEKGQSDKYAPICKGSDQCVNDPEDRDGFQDDDGCPDLDNDNDAVIDTHDKCPNIPEDMDGFEDEDGCPDPDNDKDGLCDPWVMEKGQSDKYASMCKSVDVCANDAEDKDGFEDTDGCPDPDNDKDGIPDVQDKCPNQPETVNGVEDEDGCPDKMHPPLQRSQLLPVVKFRTATAELTVEAESALEEFGKQLAEYPDSTVEIRLGAAWHSSEKKDKYLNLMQTRSKAIVDFLVGKGVKLRQLRELEYTPDNMKVLKGTDQDFNKEKPLEIFLLN